MSKSDPLSHSDMVGVIERGGSVVHNGRMISRKEDLPSPVDLAGDDMEKKRNVRNSINSQIAALQAEAAKLEVGEDSSAGPLPGAKDEAKAEAKAESEPFEDLTEAPASPEVKQKVK